MALSTRRASHRFPAAALPIFALFGLTAAAPVRADLPDDGVKLKPMFGTDGANKFVRPLWFGEIPNLKGHFLVAEQGNRTGDSAHVWLLEPQGAGYAKKRFLSLRVRQDAEEMGLLGFAFHPSFASNRKYYIDYIQPKVGADTTVIEERTADATFMKDAGEAPRRILSIQQNAINHNGGTLGFGKDGYLYIGSGDDATNGNGQSRKELKGAILRIDVDHPSEGRGYSVPQDNPFVGAADPLIRKEIWIYGLRNPWKWSFDPLDGAVWIADVGQDQQEEINVAKKGDNMGWVMFEGTRCTGSACGTEGLNMPLKIFGRDSAQCIIGGFVYRGDPASPFYGAYFFGDAVTKHVWAMTQSGGKMAELAKVAGSPSSMVSFGTDSEGSIYLVGFGTGAVYLLDHPHLKHASVGRRGAASAWPSAPALLRGAAGYALHPDWEGRALAWGAVGPDGRAILPIRPSDGAGGTLLPSRAGMCAVWIRTASGVHREMAFLD